MKTFIISAAILAFSFVQNANAQTDKNPILEQTLVASLPTENTDDSIEMPKDFEFNGVVSLLPTENDIEIVMPSFDRPKHRGFAHPKSQFIGHHPASHHSFVENESLLSAPHQAQVEHGL